MPAVTLPTLLFPYYAESSPLHCRSHRQQASVLCSGLFASGIPNRHGGWKCCQSSRSQTDMAPLDLPKPMQARSLAT